MTSVSANSNSNDMASMQSGTSSDDWTVDVEQPPKLAAPSFVRLFAINRILTQHYNIVHNEKGCMEIATIVSNLLSNMTSDDVTREIGQNILLRLKKDGIKEYMKKWYNEKEEAIIIEKMFNEIILDKFGQEHKDLVTFEAKEDYYYQNLVFNTNDLMCLIFQFLTDMMASDKYSWELTNCSLVNSQWLYHAWNPNSIYYVCLDKLIIDTIDSIKDDNEQMKNVLTRMWQRIVNVKEIHFDLSKLNLDMDTSLNPPPLLLNRLCMLRNIEIIDGHCCVEYLSVLKALLHKCKDKLVKFEIEMEMNDRIMSSAISEKISRLSPVKLMNTKRILTDISHFSFIWSNKCHTLILLWVHNITEQWCNNVINNCDCTGIKSLSLIHVSFALYFNTRSENKVLIKNVAQKFKNLTHFDINFDRTVDPYVLLLWKYLHPIIVKNKCWVCIEARNLKTQEYKQLSEYSRENWINEVIFHCHEHSRQDIINYIQQIISNSCNNLEILKFSGIISNNGVNEILMTLNNSIISYHNRDENKQVNINRMIVPLKLKVIRVKCFSPTSINKINHILKLNFIVKQKLIFSMLVYVKEYDLENFEAFCQNVHLLLVKERIGIDITVKFSQSGAEDQFNQYSKVYMSYFGDQQLKTKYKIASLQCDSKGVEKRVILLDKVNMSFKTAKEYDARYEFQVKNVELTDHDQT